MHIDRVIQLTTRHWHRHSPAPYSPAHQSRGPPDEWRIRERRRDRDQNHRRRKQHGRMGRVPAHPGPEVLRLQQDTGRDRPGNRQQNRPQRWHLTCTDQPADI